MAKTILLEEDLEIPLNLASLADFRRWALSDAFPERGRIDYVANRIEVDLSPEDIFCHGTLKTEIAAVLAVGVKQAGLGYVVCGSTRISSVEADLSAEPDVVFISHEATESGRVRLVPKASGEPGRYVEVEGAPDLIVEIVSDHSVAKDTRRLPKAYFKAGVAEYWIADARGENVAFQIHRRGEKGYEAVAPDADGFQESGVFGRRFRLDGRRDGKGNWAFDLLEETSQ